ncbi:fumarylacetoacetate hydrolase family protein [Microbacterium rhizosphaerae]|uniref:Fumarylacetoacetate hydrolase family protein n=1 Tax=Microbacterium rhizosphaerae TaxID=1678237 RepID=A0ABZ0SPA7_9MICO|nr:fumarylacetoacetate hydrolase family protein [Microbacterium rhizosphaerae]WPR89116.1 fumarylacetoacetate hydrolase family protein [Microbacterium rhizosphaerae]
MPENLAPIAAPPTSIFRTDNGVVLRTPTGDFTLAAAMAEVLSWSGTELTARVAAASAPATFTERMPLLDGRGEVWAAGVTYEQSRDARMEESETAASVYDRIYDAERPELFFKGAAWRVVGSEGTILVRADSEIDVPEPELALVLNSAGEIVGYTICDDVSSRSIEGENPLYLPQAKAYAAACAVASWFVPATEVPDPTNLTIQLVIERNGEAEWAGRTSTNLLHRALPDLAGFLFRENVFPDGVVLSTGTCLVPDLPFTLQQGDVVRVGIESLGELRNHVQRGIGTGIVQVSRDLAA